MKEDLHRTRWNRLSVRLHVPQAMGVFLLATGEQVLLVESASNLRARLLELFDLKELRGQSARVVHWVAGMSIEQARLAERQFVRTFNPPLNAAASSRYLDILAG